MSLCDICNKRPALSTGWLFGKKGRKYSKWLRRKHHFTCRQCWEKQKDRENASKLTNSYDDMDGMKENT